MIFFFSINRKQRRRLNLNDFIRTRTLQLYVIFVRAFVFQFSNFLLFGVAIELTFAGKRARCAPVSHGYSATDLAMGIVGGYGKESRHAKTKCGRLDEPISHDVTDQFTSSCPWHYFPVRFPAIFLSFPHRVHTSQRFGRGGASRGEWRYIIGDDCRLTGPFMALLIYIADRDRVSRSRYGVERTSRNLSRSLPIVIF